MANPRINLLTLPRSAAHRDAREIGRAILTHEDAIALMMPALECWFRSRYAPVGPSSMTDEQAVTAAKHLARKFRQGVAHTLSQALSQFEEAEASDE